MRTVPSDPPPAPGWRYRNVSGSASRIMADELVGHRFAYTLAFPGPSMTTKEKWYKARCSCKGWADDVWTLSRPIARKRFLKHVALAQRQGAMF